ncbi:flagellar biosynthesis anti-sigma factor FlgM [Sandaracinobacter neustonicus]|uniref:Negative regulator of flagellin synthesis n=1 Tax=Sandaracinobacter neustonicus TaxID=1715348 RepID=A0A501XES9_9SPHN|nr:flagellar biosynthesis anti-sigma factor FlgM [Sandaracinobacter neustonicus]TPE59016.1 flagellar biosynthesis anti-sigma factor FlgM [Sandaracinobacter neustonicus]
MVDQVSGGGNIPSRAALQLSSGKARVDTASISGTAPRAAENAPAKAQISAAAREMSASPPVDSAKVQSLRSAIAEGRYQIDADSIASAMIRSELPGSTA